MGYDSGVTVYDICVTQEMFSRHFCHTADLSSPCAKISGTDLAATHLFRGMTLASRKYFAQKLLARFLQRAGIALARNLPGKNCWHGYCRRKKCAKKMRGGRGLQGSCLARILQDGVGVDPLFQFHHITERWAKRLHWQIGAGQDAQLRPDLEHVPTSCAYKNGGWKTCTNNDFKGLPTNP